MTPKELKELLAEVSDVVRSFYDVANAPILKRLEALESRVSVGAKKKDRKDRKDRKG